MFVAPAGPSANPLNADNQTRFFMLRRTVVLIAVQGVIVSISLAAAIYVRLMLLSTEFDLNLYTEALPILLPIKLAAFTMSGSYRRW